MTITAQEVPGNLSKKLDFLRDNREFTKVQQREHPMQTEYDSKNAAWY
jgi:hypothetical protein